MKLNKIALSTAALAVTACVLSAPCVSLISCSAAGRLGSIKFPSTPVISTEDSVVLVLDPYISIRDQPGENGITVAHGRRGEIFDVVGKKVLIDGKEKTVWIHLKDGWVDERSVSLFSGRDKAQKAAAALE
ncbi:MAG TPA: hypothetical protein PKO22_08480 [Treponemataceae bacterium]|nr:hypothetical protein [Treponemataceae bacterium]